MKNEIIQLENEVVILKNSIEGQVSSLILKELGSDFCVNTDIGFNNISIDIMVRGDNLYKFNITYKYKFVDGDFCPDLYMNYFSYGGFSLSLSNSRRKILYGMSVLSNNDIFIGKLYRLLDMKNNELKELYKKLVELDNELDK